jgi:hypothetical protein
MAERFLTDQKRSIFCGGIYQRAQSTLELAVVLVLLILLLGGITNIWLWGNRQIVLRQIRYNASRVIAGSSKDALAPDVSDPYLRQWPLVYRPQESEESERTRPEHLKEEEVLLAAPQLK